MYKKLSIILASTLVLSVGCGSTENTSKVTDGEKIVLTVGAWPKENNEHELAIYNKWKEEFEKANPNVSIVPEPYSYDPRTFVAKAASEQLPNLFVVPYTEPMKIIRAGYVADITEVVKKFGYEKELKPNLLEVTKSGDKIYGLPKMAYMLGLWCNTKLFKQAGLVDSEGVPVFPKTFDEMRAAAVTIKEKTGVDGYMLPAKDNTAGWHFTNMAWNYGTVFETEVDGNWKATFNTPETIEALNLIKNLRHVDNVLPENALLGYSDILKTFALDQVGMVIGALEAPMINMMINQYKMDKDTFSICSIPAGPKDKTSLMGGEVMMFSANSTPEQVEAAIKFMEVCGYSPRLDDISSKGLEEQYKADIEAGNVVLHEAVSVWDSPERYEKEKEIRAKYANINPAMINDYFENVYNKINAEPTYNCQDLYKELSSLIQTILVEPDADIPKLLEKAQNDFQINYLDKVK